MLTESIEMCGHTTPDGMLNLSLHVGVSDADVAVVVRVRPLVPAGEIDANGWPKGFFERVAGSMPELRRPPEGDFEDRLSLG